MLSLILISMALLGNVVATASGDEHKCPDSYSLNDQDNTCVKVYDDLRMAFSDAQKACKKEQAGGDLVHVQDIASNAFIKGMLTTDRRYWLGITKATDGGLTFTNGSRLSFDAPWARGEPNNHGGNERCVEIIANKRGAWNDKRCSRKRPFVCQVDAERVRAVDAYDAISCDFETDCHYSFDYSIMNVTSGREDNYMYTAYDSSGVYLTSPRVVIYEPSCLSFNFKGQNATISSFTDQDPSSETILKVKRVKGTHNQVQWNLIKATVASTSPVRFVLKVARGSIRAYNIKPTINNITLLHDACS